MAGQADLSTCIQVTTIFFPLGVRLASKKKPGGLVIFKLLVGPETGAKLSVTLLCLSDTTQQLARVMPSDPNTSALEGIVLGNLVFSVPRVFPSRTFLDHTPIL